MIYCGSGSDFEKVSVSVPAPVPDPDPEPHPDHIHHSRKNFCTKSCLFNARKMASHFDFFTFSTFVFHFMLDPARSAKSKKKLRS